MDLGIPELTEEQIKMVSQAAEAAARKHIFYKVSPKLVDKLNISVEAIGAKPVSFAVEVDLVLMPQTESINEKTLANEAVKEAFITIENCLRKLT